MYIPYFESFEPNDTITPPFSSRIERVASRPVKSDFVAYTFQGRVDHSFDPPLLYHTGGLIPFLYGYIVMANVSEIVGLTISTVQKFTPSSPDGAFL